MPATRPRVRALLKPSRAMPDASRATVLKNKELELDLARHRVFPRGGPLDLTPTEFRLLSYFMRNPGKILSHAELLTHVWGAEYAGEDQYLRLCVRYLRQKLEDDPNNPTYISNVRGKGYRFRES